MNEGRRKRLLSVNGADRASSSTSTGSLQLKPRRQESNPPAADLSAAIEDELDVSFARLGSLVLPDEWGPVTLSIETAAMVLRHKHGEQRLSFKDIHQVWYCQSPDYKFIVIGYHGSILAVPQKYWNPNASDFSMRSLTLQLAGVLQSKFDRLLGTLRQRLKKTHVKSLSHSQPCYKIMPEEAFLEGLKKGSLLTFWTEDPVESSDDSEAFEGVFATQDVAKQTRPRQNRQLPSQLFEPKPKRPTLSLPTLLPPRRTGTSNTSTPTTKKPKVPVLPQAPASSPATATVLIPPTSVDPASPAAPAPSNVTISTAEPVHEVLDDSLCAASSRDGQDGPLGDSFALADASIGPTSSSGLDLPRLQTPKVSLDGIDISQEDLDRCQPEEFLNDNIIDWYIAFLSRRLITPLQQSVFTFNTHFFKVLKRDSAKCARRWQKKEPILRKKFIFIPINECVHWWLLLLYNVPELCDLQAIGVEAPKKTKQKRLLKTMETEARRRKKAGSLPTNSSVSSTTGAPDQPNFAIYQLNSMASDVSSETIALIKDFILTRYKVELQVDDVPANIKERLANTKVQTMEVPQQDNSTDCGVFMLHYLELFYENAFLEKFVQDPPGHMHLNEWFPTVDIPAKRQFLIDLVLELDKHPELSRRKNSGAVSVDQNDFFSKRQARIQSVESVPLTAPPPQPTPALPPPNSAITSEDLLPEEEVVHAEDTDAVATIVDNNESEQAITVTDSEKTPENGKEETIHIEDTPECPAPLGSDPEVEVQPRKKRRRLPVMGTPQKKKKMMQVPPPPPPKPAANRVTKSTSSLPSPPVAIDLDAETHVQ